MTQGHSDVRGLGAEPPILSDIHIDALELEAHGYTVVSQEYLRRLEAVTAIAAAVVAGQADVETLAKCLSPG